MVERKPVLLTLTQLGWKLREWARNLSPEEKKKARAILGVKG